MEVQQMDGTDNQKDTLQVETGQSSTDEKQGTSKEAQSRTYTDADIQKAINDALAKAGRDNKQLSEREAALKAQEEAIKAQQVEIEEYRKRIEQNELEEAQSDPDKMREYQRKQAEKKAKSELEIMRAELKKQQDELNRARAEHETEVKAARETMTEIRLWQIGAKYGVNPVLLKELNLSSIEQAEQVAKRLGTTNKPAASENKTPSEKPFTPDSGVSSGNYGNLTPAQFEKLPMSEKQKYLSKH